MVATFVIDTLGMNDEGMNIEVEWEPFETANRIVASVRECARDKLRGK